MSTWTVSDPFESGTKKPRGSPVTDGLQSRVTSMAVGARLVLLLGYTGFGVGLGSGSSVARVAAWPLWSLSPSRTAPGRSERIAGATGKTKDQSPKLNAK